MGFLIDTNILSELRKRERCNAGVRTWFAGVPAEQLGVPDPLPVADGLIAATALVHDLTLVTRNTRDMLRAGVRLLDPHT